MLRRYACAVLILITVSFSSVAQQKKTAVQKLARLVQPWPDEAALTERRKDADARALFQGTQPLDFTLESNFAAINKEREPNSSPRYPGVLKTSGPDGQTKAVDVQLSPRGHLRRRTITCEFVPLRLEFSAGVMRGTAFEGPATALKLITHCQNSKEHEQFVLREYLAYRLSNILTPQSFRARLAKVSYVDSKTKKTLTTRLGMLLEDDSDVARRMGGRVVAVERTSFTDLDPRTLAQMMLFEFMLGNTDFSIFALHNVVLVQMPGTRILYPVPYDFDLSGFVHAPYAAPAPNLGVKSVLERVYRGPCLTPDQWEPVFSVFHAKKDELLAAVNSNGDLVSEARSEVRSFLNDFFTTIDRSSTVNRFFINGCKRTTM